MRLREMINGIVIAWRAGDGDETCLSEGDRKRRNESFR